MISVAGVRPHTSTHVSVLCFSNSLLLPCPQVSNNEPKVMTLAPLVSNTSFLCWHLWWQARALWVAQQHCRPSLIPFIESKVKIPHFPNGIPLKSCKSVNQMANITTEVMASLLALNKARFGSPAGNHSFSFTRVQPPTPYSLASQDTTCWRNVEDHTDRFLFVIYHNWNFYQCEMVEGRLHSHLVNHTRYHLSQSVFHMFKKWLLLSFELV